MEAADPLEPFVAALANSGTVRGACAAGGLAEAAVRRRLAEDPKFRLACEAALATIHAARGVAAIVAIPDNGRDPA